ncbi:hypothetical protein G6F60_006162 [Rhizopus arrhizus]|uniref:NADP-dependent oxidoreductase domain-containing protein n=1 Tax=Rhizopus oryzae TaxID=64495 RepID=A0A9P6X485_RHIOR|nr:hypothetical protein G6F64_008783 [Rhizopus arrhizus]KAG1370309.1 hypothetical protein G6F61_012148 [Rhizopus arrhizus]KAG1401777.1 hypothetical protein G6F60_006162 [Rhizopus arrhizus]
MQYVRLGNTGMKVSRFCLGCMSYGSSKWMPWVKDEEESINLIDVYSNGESERVLGEAIKKFNLPRSRIVVATKVFFIVNEKDVPRSIHGQGVDKEPAYVNALGLSRKHIFDAVDASLKRLDLDYIDLYQIHRLDSETPLEETMEALNDLVRSGKVRYIGASSMSAWQFQKANAIANKNGWAKFVSMQNMYNLIHREEEREMIPYCYDSGIASIHWSPLAKGLLIGKNRDSVRKNTDIIAPQLFGDKLTANDDAIIDRVIEIAEKYNRSPAQIALAWMLTKPHVTSPIVGFSKESQIIDTVKSLEVKLTEEDVKYLEELYVAREPIPFMIDRLK